MSGSCERRHHRVATTTGSAGGPSPGPPRPVSNTHGACITQAPQPTQRSRSTRISTLRCGMDAVALRGRRPSSSWSSRSQGGAVPFLDQFAVVAEAEHRHVLHPRMHQHQRRRGPLPQPAFHHGLHHDLETADIGRREALVLHIAPERAGGADVHRHAPAPRRGRPRPAPACSRSPPRPRTSGRRSRAAGRCRAGRRRRRRRPPPGRFGGPAGPRGPASRVELDGVDDQRAVRAPRRCGCPLGFRSGASSGSRR